MVPLSIIRASNASLPTTHPNPTALFVGATSGLGLATLTSYAQQIPSPKIYIVGRSRTKLSSIISHLRTLNPAATYHPLISEISLLKNVDTVCSTLSQSESHLDHLVLSPGFFKLSPQAPTADGINPVLALTYYVRARFIYNLLPLLHAAVAARVLSVFGAGYEGRLDEDDLLLKEGYSMQKVTTHTATMNTLFLREIARRHDTISCVHVFPGMVVTPLFERMAEGWWTPARWGFRGVVMPLMRLFASGLEETGERFLYLVTSGMYPPREGSGGVELGEGMQVARGADGEVGSGCYLVGWGGETVGDRKLLDWFGEEGWDGRVWRHTMSIFEQAGVKVQ